MGQYYLIANMDKRSIQTSAIDEISDIACFSWL